MHGEFLRTACARINDLREPVFIKDSTLNYVAVNRAYAALFGLLPHDLAGRPSRDVSSGTEDPRRREKECRALIFGTEETVPCDDIGYVIAIERFVTEDDRTYL